MPSPLKIFILTVFLISGGNEWCCVAYSQEEEVEEKVSEEETTEEEPEEEEEVYEPQEKLVFVEAYSDGVDSVDGLNGVYSVAVSPDGKYVYAAAINDDAVSVFTRNESNGELTFSSIIRDGENGIDCLNGARSIALSPDGEFLYVASMFSNTLTSFSRDSVTGALTYLGCITDGVDGVDGLAGARSVTISPSGEHLYVAAYDDDALSVFQRNIETGSVSFLGRLKNGEGAIDGLNGPHYLSVSPDGKNVYVALWDENAVSRFTRDVSTGLLTYENKYVNGVDIQSGLEGPRAIVFSPKGEFVYVASWNDDAVTTLSRDLDTGELASSSIVKNENDGVEGIDGPHSLVVSAEGKFLYVTSFFDDAISVFVRDDETGELTYDQSLFNSEEQVEKLNGVLTVAISGDGEHVYAATLSDRSLVAFRREFVVDPPVISVEPESKSIPFGESVAFNSQADGFEVTYQWQLDGVDIDGENSKVLNIDSVDESHDGNIYRLIASNLGGVIESGEAVLTVLPPITLDAPLALTALAVSSEKAELNWRDESDNENGFELQRKTSDSEFETVGVVFSDTVQYEDTSLDAGTTYIYRVRATKGFEVSSWSNESVIESFDAAPNSPQNLLVEESEYNHVTLKWEDLSAVEDGYRIQRRNDFSGSSWVSIATVEASIEMYEDWSVSAEQTYSYRISAYNESGESGYSNVVSAQIDSNPVSSITPESRIVPGGQSESNLVLVTATRDWLAYTNYDWLIIESPLGGEGVVGTALSYKVLANTLSEERIGTINVGGIWHTVTQEASVDDSPIPSLDSFAINDGVFVTSSREVTLSHGFSGVNPTEYRASEFIDFLDAAWLTYETAPLFSLSEGDGVKQVYFQLRNENGTSSVLSDIISYAEEVLAEDVPSLDSFTIADGASETEDLLVSLSHVYSGFEPTEYRVSESSDFFGTDWQAYASSIGFTLSTGEGEKTIYLQLRNDNGTSEILGDSINYIEVDPTENVPNLDSFAIADGASETENLLVSISHAYSGIDPMEYRVSELLDFSDTDWQAYSSSIGFTLSAGEGEKTVYLQLRNENGMSEILNDSISYIEGDLTENIPSLDSFAIENGANETEARSVGLTLSYSGVDPTHYRVSEFLDFSDTDWVTYESPKNMILSEGMGEKTVYLQLKNENGVSQVLSDSITLTGPLIVGLKAVSELVYDVSSGLGVQLGWIDDSSTEIGYIVERRVDGESNWVGIVSLSGDSVEYMDADSVPGVAYQYRVFAFNGSGNGTAVELDVGTVPQSNLVNLSTRAYVGSGESVLIAGFVLDEGESTDVFLRSVGPEIERQFAVENALSDPAFFVVRPGASPDDPNVAENDDWGDAYLASDVAVVENEVGAFSILDSPTEAAAAMNVGAGAYTAVVYSSNGPEGVALAELYSMSDASSGASRLANLSTRAFVGTGANIIIGGFVIDGDVPLPILIRGLGPALVAQGVSESLADPQIHLLRGQDIIAQNNDWASDQESELVDAFEKVGASRLETNSKDAALLVILEPGAYTCFVSGVEGGQGIGLFEVYSAR
ncbi:beta-propeller fold lactonase family protein [Puniceicoccaceae bacterium K14]|nr:beta-propeller fold lactonase family protein [Puniceicoccaceae bacterium K14]